MLLQGYAYTVVRFTGPFNPVTCVNLLIQLILPLPNKYGYDKDCCVNVHAQQPKAQTNALSRLQYVCPGVFAYLWLSGLA